MKELLGRLLDEFQDGALAAVPPFTRTRQEFGALLFAVICLEYGKTSQLKPILPAALRGVPKAFFWLRFSIKKDSEVFAIAMNSSLPAKRLQHPKRMTEAALAANRANARKCGRPPGKMNATKLALSERCRVRDEEHVKILETLAADSKNPGLQLSAISRAF